MKDFTYVRKDVKEERVVTPACLVESYPFKASDIVSEKKYADLNITEVILKNDLRILLRPTNDESQSIL